MWVQNLLFGHPVSGPSLDLVTSLSCVILLLNLISSIMIKRVFYEHYFNDMLVLGEKGRKGGGTGKDGRRERNLRQAGI